MIRPVTREYREPINRNLVASVVTQCLIRFPRSYPIPILTCCSFQNGWWRTLDNRGDNDRRRRPLMNEWCTLGLSSAGFPVINWICCARVIRTSTRRDFPMRAAWHAHSEKVLWLAGRRERWHGSRYQDNLYIIQSCHGLCEWDPLRIGSGLRFFQMEIDKISRINSILSFKLINLLLFSNGSFWDLRYFSDEFHSHSLHYTLLTRIKCDNKTVFLAVCVLCKYRIIIRTYLSISLPSGNNNLLEVRRIGCLLTTHEEHATYYY